MCTSVLRVSFHVRVSFHIRVSFHVKGSFPTRYIILDIVHKAKAKVWTVEMGIATVMKAKTNSEDEIWLDGSKNATINKLDRDGDGDGGQGQG